MRADRVGYGIGTSAPQAVGASNVTGVNVQPGTATLSVRVRNAAGTLTQGVNVTAGSQRADTGADGIARFPGLPGGQLRGVRRRRQRGRERADRDLAAGGTTFDVQTAAPATLNGTVRDANGQPVRRRARARHRRHGRDQLVLTGADGRYSFTRLKAGAYEVSYADGKRRAHDALAGDPGDARRDARDRGHAAVGDDGRRGARRCSRSSARRSTPRCCSPAPTG